jgi:hypothetical protein
MSRIDDIEAREKAASAGPWKRSRNYLGGAYLVSVRSLHVTVAEGFLKRDAEFIAHARQDIPDLLAFVHEMTALADEWEGASPGAAVFAEGIRERLDRLNEGDSDV